jgi:hypothetical protein
MNEFDPDLEVKKLKEQTSTIRKTRYSKSRLDRYKGELLTLSQSGATCAELQRYLRTKRIKVVHSTVARWLAKNG